MTAELLTLPAVVPTEAPFRRDGLGYVFEPAGLGITLKVDYLERGGRYLYGELVVTATRPGLPSGVLRTQWNLNSAKETLSVAGALARRGEEGKRLTLEEWLHLLELFATEATAAHERGDDAEELGGLPLEARQWVTERLLEGGQWTILYGPPGAAKGWLAVALALSVRYGRPFCGLRVQRRNVLYLDYEDDRAIFNARVQAVGAGLGIADPRLWRWRPHGSIPRVLHRLAALVDEHDVGLLIVDSIGHAYGPPGERGSWEDIAIAGANALKHLPAGLAVLLIDHTSAEGTRAGFAGKAGGAQRKMGDARIGWEIRNSQEQEGSTVHVGLQHAKKSNTTYYAPLGFRLDFTSDADGRAVEVRFSREDVRDVEGLSGNLSQPDQFIGALMRRGKLTTPELVDELGGTWTAKLVNQVGGRLAARGRVVFWGGGKGRGRVSTWALAAPEPPSEKTPHLYRNDTVEFSSAATGRRNSTPNTPQTPHVEFSRENGASGWFPGASDDDDEEVSF